MEKTAKRRMRSKAERRQIVEETYKSGASVAQIARAHGVNANQVFNWRKLYHAGQLETDSTLLPVKIADVAPVVVAPRAKRGEKLRAESLTSIWATHEFGSRALLIQHVSGQSWKDSGDDRIADRYRNLDRRRGNRSSTRLHRT